MAFQNRECLDCECGEGSPFQRSILGIGCVSTAYQKNGDMITNRYEQETTLKEDWGVFVCGLHLFREGRHTGPAVSWEYHVPRLDFSLGNTDSPLHQQIHSIRFSKKAIPPGCWARSEETLHRCVRVEEETFAIRFRNCLLWLRHCDVSSFPEFLCPLL